MDLLWRMTFRIAYRAALCYWYLFRPETRGVYVAVWCGPEILLIRNSYKSKQTLPAGGVKRGESDVDAAVRELREEVGIHLTAEDLTLFQCFVSNEEFKTDKSVVFEARLEQVPNITVDRCEVVHAEFVESREASQRELVSVVQQYMSPEAGTN